jgi:hypothetical protein
MKKIREWLSENDDKIGKSGKPVKSNITDNESAKMKTSKGVIQGYDGVTAVDGKHRVIVHAEAFGRALYAIRLAIGEPPFANIRSALRLDRFILYAANER